MNRLFRYLRSIIYLNGDVDTRAASQVIRQNIYFRGPNVFILGCAIIIASVGLNVNSIPVIIGAMLISPLMGPIMGFGLGLGTNDTGLIRTALKNLAVMVTISILASTLYFLLTPLSLAHPTELLARTRPTVYDVLVALFGGAAGILETSRKEKGTVLSGVAIATALMPPLCTVGFGLATAQWHYAFGAIYLFLLNSILIALSTYLMVKYLHYPEMGVEVYIDGRPIEEDPQLLRRRSHRRGISIVMVIMILIVPSIWTAYSVIRENVFLKQANILLDTHKTIGHSYVYRSEIDESNQQIHLYLAGTRPTEDERKLFLAEASELGLNVDCIELHEDALSKGISEQVQSGWIKDLIDNKDEQIRVLQDRLALAEAHQSVVFPTEQITREIKTQYPEIETVRLAHAEQLDTVGNVVPSIWVYAVPRANQHLNDVQRQRLESWLQERLNTPDLQLRLE